MSILSSRMAAFAVACAMTASLASAEQKTFPGWKRIESEAAGAKVVLVDFWASWCAPCKASFPELDKLQKEYRDRGLVIVAVSVDEKASDASAFLKKHPISFKTLHDSDQTLVAGAGIEAMPTSFVLDASGRILSMHRGFEGEKTVKLLRAEIEQALEQKAGNAP